MRTRLSLNIHFLHKKSRTRPDVPRPESEKVRLPSSSPHLPPSCLLIIFLYLTLHLFLSLPRNRSILPLPAPTSPRPRRRAGVAEGKGRGGCLKSHRGYLIRNSKASST